MASLSLSLSLTQFVVMSSQPPLPLSCFLCCVWAGDDATALLDCLGVEVCCCIQEQYCLQLALSTDLFLLAYGDFLPLFFLFHLVLFLSFSVLSFSLLKKKEENLNFTNFSSAYKVAYYILFYDLAVQTTTCEILELIYF